MSPERLVYMANQIGKYFISQPGDRAVLSVADHLRKFWDLRMRQAILAHADQGGAGLDPVVLQAVQSLRS